MVARETFVQALFRGNIHHLCYPAGNGWLAGDDPAAMEQASPNQPDFAGFCAGCIHSRLQWGPPHRAGARGGDGDCRRYDQGSGWPATRRLEPAPDRDGRYLSKPGADCHAALSSKCCPQLDAAAHPGKSPRTVCHEHRRLSFDRYPAGQPNLTWPNRHAQRACADGIPYAQSAAHLHSVPIPPTSQPPTAASPTDKPHPVHPTEKPKDPKPTKKPKK